MRTQPDQTFETDTAVSAPVLLVVGLISLALVIFLIASYWKMYIKAGQPGWAAIVPFYNIYVLLKLVGRPGWWLILFFIPLVNLIMSIILMIDLAKAFGRGGGFAVLLIFLPYVGVPILAFGQARYVGPVADPNFNAYGQGGYPEPGYPGAPNFQTPPPYAQHPGQQYPPQQYPQQQYPPQQYPPQQPGQYPPQHPGQQYPPQQYPPQQ